MRIVVCDTGPVLHLSEARALDLLEKTGEVLIPPIVDREIARHVPDWTSRRPGWLRVESPPHPVAGQPAVSLLLAWHDGLPVGVQVVTRFAADATLLRLSAQLERCFPWADRVPPVSV